MAGRTERRSSEGRDRLIIFGRYPRAGRVKTRLASTLGDEHAAQLYRAFLLDAVDMWSRAGRHKTVLAIDDQRDIDAMQHLLAEEVPCREGEEGVRIIAQQGTSLGTRLAIAFEDAFREGCRMVCAIGSDHPTVPLTMIESAFDTSHRSSDIVIGPAEDGGYWLIGMRRAHPELFEGMPFSSERLFDATCGRTRSLGLGVRGLGTWYDVDTWNDLARMWRARRTSPPGPRTLDVLERMMPGLMAGSGEEA